MTADAASELQRAVYAALVVDAAVADLIAGRIYDGLSASSVWPCASFGPSDIISAPAEGIAAEEHVLQLDLWTRDGTMQACRTLLAAARDALDWAPLGLPDPLRLVQLRAIRAQVMADPDGISAHGVLILSALIQRGG